MHVISNVLRKVAGADESIYASCAEIVECERNFKRVGCFQAATECSALPVKQIHPGIGCMRFARLSEADGRYAEHVIRRNSNE